MLVPFVLLLVGTTAMSAFVPDGVVFTMFLLVVRALPEIRRKGRTCRQVT